MSLADQEEIEIQRADKERAQRTCELLLEQRDLLLAACKAAKRCLEIDLVEPGRTVFWKLVEAIAKVEKEHV